MRRWLGLFAVLAFAAVGTVALAVRVGRDDYGTRHSLLRPGMPSQQAITVMDGPDFQPALLHGIEGIQQGESHYLAWRTVDPSRSYGSRRRVEVEFRAYIGANNRVTRTTVNIQ